MKILLDIWHKWLDCGIRTWIQDFRTRRIVFMILEDNVIVLSRPIGCEKLKIGDIIRNIRTGENMLVYSLVGTVLRKTIIDIAGRGYGKTKETKIEVGDKFYKIGSVGYIYPQEDGTFVKEEDLLKSDIRIS